MFVKRAGKEGGEGGGTWCARRLETAGLQAGSKSLARGVSGESRSHPIDLTFFVCLFFFPALGRGCNGVILPPNEKFLGSKALMDKRYC